MAPGEAALGATASMTKSQLTQQVTAIFSKRAHVELAGQYGGGLLATSCNGGWLAYTVTGGPLMSKTLNPAYTAVAAWQQRALRAQLPGGHPAGTPPPAPGGTGEWTVTLGSGGPITLTKTNSCGNNMMKASQTSGSS